MKNLIVLHWDYESKLNEKGLIPIYIDPSYVVFIRESISNKNSTYISFSNGSSITVKEDINYVYQKINGK